jgi:hypothetical protein
LERSPEALLAKSMAGEILLKSREKGGKISGKNW